MRILLLAVLLMPIPAMAQPIEGPVEQVARQALKKYLSAHCDRFQVQTIRRSSLQQPAINSSLQLRGEVGSYPFPVKRMKVTVQEDKEVGAVRRWTVGFKVGCYAQVWVSKERIEQNSSLNRQIVQRQERDIAGVTGKVAGVIGNSSAKRVLPQGKVILARDLRIGEFISKNDQVKLIVQLRSIRFEYQTIAVSSAAVGENIWLASLDSHKKIKAVVIGNNLAQIE